MRTELQRLHKELDTTIIYVTHDQAEAMTMSDRIAVINSGVLQQIDPPLVCYNEPANQFVAGFIGSPSMNFIKGEVVTDGFDSDIGNVGIEFDPTEVGVETGARVTAGVRPEDVYPAEYTDELTHPSRRISVRTDVLEPMGDEIFVYLVTDEDAEVDLEDPDAGGQLLMSVEPDSTIEEDQQMEVVLDRSKIHLFDVENEQALVHGLVDVGSPAGTAGRAASDD
jgi:multiple sugar transport system ATP-binding protein